MALGDMHAIIKKLTANSTVVICDEVNLKHFEIVLCSWYNTPTDCTITISRNKGELKIKSLF